MLLALVFGKAQGVKLSDNIKKNKTNIEIDCFETISEYCNTSIIRHKIYDRTLFLGAKASIEELDILYDYWFNKTPRETDLILLGKQGAEDEICKQFLTKFNTPKVATVSIPTVTLSILMETINNPVGQLQDKYGIVIDRNTEVEEGIDLGFGAETEKNTVETETNTEVDTEETQEDKPKKKSLLGAILGTNKQVDIAEKKEVKPKKQKQTVNNIDNNVDTPTDNGVSNTMNNGFEPMPMGNDGFEPMPMGNDGFEPMPMGNDGFEPMPMGNDGFEPMPMSNDGFEPMPMSNDGFESMPMNNDGVEPMSMGNETMKIAPNTNENSVENIAQENISEIDDMELDANTAFDALDELTFNGFQPQTDIPFEDKDAMGKVDELAFSGFTSEVVTPTTKKDIPVIDTSLDLNGINTAQAETKYRQKTEQPKIIEKTVIRNVVDGNGNLSVINNIKGGKLHKVLIITGDRGSGITSAALSIARYFSKYTNVLYFDCDIQNHGVLNYLDYVKLQDYEEMQLVGVHACKSSREFDYCKFEYDVNLDFLTSDYSIEVSDGDLQCAQKVVASEYTRYSLTVIDCPFNNLHLLQDLFLLGDAIFCIEATNRGIMNYLCQSALTNIDDRYARTLVSKGTIFETKLTNKVDSKKVFDYYISIYEPEVGETNWLDMERYKFNGKIDEKVMNKVLER